MSKRDNVLNTRVPRDEHQDFHAICVTLGSTPSYVLRRLVRAYISQFKNAHHMVATGAVHDIAKAEQIMNLTESAEALGIPDAKIVALIKEILP